MHRLTAAMPALCAASLIAACGGAPVATPTPSASTAVPAVQLSGTLALGGDYTFTVSFTTDAVIAADSTAASTTPAPTCSAYAADSGTSFAVPVVTATQPRPVFLRVSLKAGYHGAGLYTSGATTVFTGTAAVSIPTAEGFSVQTYRSTDASPMTLTVHADGSGTFSFRQWRTDEVRGQYIAGHLDGTVSWRCG